MYGFIERTPAIAKEQAATKKEIEEIRVIFAYCILYYILVDPATLLYTKTNEVMWEYLYTIIYICTVDVLIALNYR